MTDINAHTLFEKYESELNKIFNQILADKERAIPYIVMKITTQTVPSMASDLGRVTSLSGSIKKQLIIDAIELAINEIFQKLNKFPEFADETWDDDLKALLLTLIGPILDNLIAVENGRLVFNKTVTTGLFKLFSCCPCMKGRRT